MKVDILILYEHINRELESALFLESKLKQKGYSVEVAQVGWNEGKYKSCIEPKIIVTPWCYDDSDVSRICDYKGAYSQNRMKIVNLHCEQITSNEAMELLIPSGKAKETYHLAWGAFFQEHLLNAGVKENMTCVTGSPRLDFFNKRCYAINKQKEELAKEFGLDASKKWVLLVGNFSAAFTPEDTILSLEKRGYKNIREQSILAKKSYAEILKWYEAICETSDFTGEIEFIYRPHPSEKLSGQIEELEKRFHNFHIIRGYAIRDWFVNADIAFTWNSTSAIEAFFSEKPVLSLRPIKIPQDLSFEILEHVEQVTSLDKFMQTVYTLLNDEIEVKNEAFGEHINYYYSVQDELAVDITVEFIDQIISKDDEGMFASEYSFVKSWRKRINFYLKVLAYKLRILQKREKYVILSNDYITKETMDEYRRKIAKLR